MDAFSHADEVDACISKKEKILNDSRRNRLDQVLNDATTDNFNDLLMYAHIRSGRRREETPLADPETFDRTGA